MGRIKRLWQTQWRIGLGVIIAFFVLSVGLSLFYGSRASELEAVGVEAQATVTDKFTNEDIDSEGLVTTSLNFSYEWLLEDGSTHRFVAPIPGGEWEAISIGDSGPVVYNPENPNQHDSPWGTQNEVADMWLGFAVLAFLAFLIVFAVGLWRTGRAPRDTPTDL